MIQTRRIQSRATIDESSNRFTSSRRHSDETSDRLLHLHRHAVQGPVPSLSDENDYTVFETEREAQ